MSDQPKASASQLDPELSPNASFQPAWWWFKPGTPISNTDLTQSLEQFAANLDTVGSLMWGDRDISRRTSIPSAP